MFQNKSVQTMMIPMTHKYRVSEQIGLMNDSMTHSLIQCFWTNRFNEWFNHSLI